MSQIHPTAVIDPKAEIGNNVCIGPFSIIEADVKIADNVSIGQHVLIASGPHINSFAAAAQAMLRPCA